MIQKDRMKPTKEDLLFREACIAGNINEAKRLRNIITIESVGASSLYLSALNGHQNIVEYLINQNVKDLHDCFISQSIEYASSNNHVDIVKYLVSLGHMNDLGDSIIRASSAGYIDMIRYLISINCNIELDNHRAYRLAVKNKHLECAQLLAYHQALLDIQRQ